MWVGRCRTGRAPRRPASPGTAAISSFARKWPQEAYAAFWATDLWALMGPRSRLVGLEWRPGSPFGVAERLQNPMDFSEFVVWERSEVAPSDKADKKSNTRALECCGSIGATPGGLRADRLPRGQLRFPRSRGSGPERPTPRSEQLTFARLWARGAAGLASSGVRAHPSGSQKGYRTPWSLVIFVLKQVEVAPGDEADGKSDAGALECCGSIGATPGELHTARLPGGQLRSPRSRGSGPKRPTPRSGQLTFGRLWARGAAGLASSGVRARPSGSRKGYTTRWMW